MRPQIPIAAGSLLSGLARQMSLEPALQSWVSYASNPFDPFALSYSLANVSPPSTTRTAPVA